MIRDLVRFVLPAASVLLCAVSIHAQQYQPFKLPNSTFTGAPDALVRGGQRVCSVAARFMRIFL
jgi:hypothetical protein